MNKLRILAAALFFCCNPVVRSQSIAPLQTYVFTHANVIDGVSKEALRDASVVVKDGRIDSVNPSGAAVPAGATTIDLQGRWLLPGYIDVHAHVPDMVAARRALRSG